jgi:NAD(P)-dependent dehydrogenase (short-subunit alcohol dehydrogenase family)
MSNDFDGKRVLVTGASRGIGYATALEFLALGARVAVNGSTRESTDAAVARLAAGDRAVPVPGNVAKVSECDAIAKTAIGALGGLDVLVNNAGVAEDATMEETSEALWDRTVDVNLKGTFFCSRASLAALRSAKGVGSAIVNVASVSGLEGYGENTVYCASKGGVVNLTRAMAVELAPTIRVNCVCPGYVDTDMVRRDYFDQSDDPAASELEAAKGVPLQRIATPQEIARAICYLASPDARFITGHALTMDGGRSIGE